MKVPIDYSTRRFRGSTWSDPPSPPPPGSRHPKQLPGLSPTSHFPLRNWSPNVAFLDTRRHTSSSPPRSSDAPRHGRHIDPLLPSFHPPSKQNEHLSSHERQQLELWNVRPNWVVKESNGMRPVRSGCQEPRPWLWTSQFSILDVLANSVYTTSTNRGARVLALAL
jgi:hypothetical protein